MTDITVVDKVTGNQLTAAEFQQLLNALKNQTISVNTDAMIAKSAHIGGPTSYTEFTENGGILLHADARAKKTLQFPASGLKTAGVSPATSVSLGLDGALEFSNVTNENGSFSFFIRDEMDRTVDPTIRFGWSSPEIAGNVIWQIQYLWIGPDSDTSVVVPDEVLTDTVTVSSTANGYKLANFTLAAPTETDRTCQIKITRLATDDLDTAEGAANLIVVVMEFTSNKLGMCCV